MSNYSKKILKILGEKTAVSVPELQEKLITTPNPLLNKEGARYAITRSLKSLREAGLVENSYSGQNNYARLTTLGKKKINTLKLEDDTTLVNTVWDGFWRIILLDIPESRKSERESLRYLLKKAGFVCLKNSAWISPYPYENLFINIKKDLGFTTELMIIVTDKLDEETRLAFLEAIKN